MAAQRSLSGQASISSVPAHHVGCLIVARHIVPDARKTTRRARDAANNPAKLGVEELNRRHWDETKRTEPSVPNR